VCLSLLVEPFDQALFLSPYKSSEKKKKKKKIKIKNSKKKKKKKKKKIHILTVGQNVDMPKCKLMRKFTKNEIKQNLIKIKLEKKIKKKN